MYTSRGTYHQLVFVHMKTDASPIFIVSRINAKFLALIQRAENRLDINFYVITHQQVICPPIAYQNTSLPAKYGGSTTIITNFSPKPVRAQNTPQNGVYFARTRFWVTNPCFWEFNLRISPTIVSDGPCGLGIYVVGRRDRII